MSASSPWNANPVVREVTVRKKTRQSAVEKRSAAIASWFSLATDNEDEEDTAEDPIDEEEIFGEITLCFLVYHHLYRRFCRPDSFYQ
jgi:hypothetical protein